MDDIEVVALCDQWHPTYGPYWLTGIIPSPPDVFAAIAQLQEQGDPDGELPELQRLLVKMAQLICRDTAITFALLCDRQGMPQDVRRLVTLCLPPAEPGDEAFVEWLRVARRRTEMELQNIQSSDLAPDAKQATGALVEMRLLVLEQQANTAEERAMQVVGVWWLTEQAGLAAGVPLAAVAVSTASQEANELAHRLCPFDSDFILALSEVRGTPLKDLAAKFRRSLSKHTRIGANPSGTGRHPKREHEKADTKFLRGEGDRRPLEREPDPQPEKLQWLVPKRYDPLEHVLQQEGAQQLFSAAKGKTRQLVELVMQGLEVREAARLIGISPNSAYVLLCRLRKKISRRF